MQFTLRANRLIDPSSGDCRPGVVEVHGGKITSCRSAADASGDWDIDRGVLLPGLIDMHAHPANGGSVFGVAPDEYMLPHGVTTVMSQGDAGADNLDRYLKQTIQSSAVRVLLAINLSRTGESTTTGCFSVT